MPDPGFLGVLAPTRGGGALRQREHAYLPHPSDPSVPQHLIQRLDLRPGDEIQGNLAPGGRRQVQEVTAINGRSPADLGHRAVFSNLRSLHPAERLQLTTPGSPDLTSRVIDLFAPLGKGQRALVVAPAKAGKTTVLQRIATGIATNHPECTLYILLVDERPEEVSEMEAIEVGEVISSSFDHGANRHVAVAEMTLERACRKVELGEDVVIIMDSITRLARAHNTAERGRGRTMSGGIDAGALERPKKFFGSARLVDPKQGGGSLTIIATALVDTGSRMDQVIFEEFKGTGNSEIVLNREMAERRIFPAIDLGASATRREERLLAPEMLEAAHRLRQEIADQRPADAMALLTTLLRRHTTDMALAAAV